MTNHVNSGRGASSLDEPTDRVGFTDCMVQLSFAVQAILQAAGAEENLSLTQVRLLGVLRDRRLKVLQIAAVLGLEKSSTSGLIDRAERRGLLSRSASDDDGRAVLVTLSATGQAVAERVRATVEAALQQLAQPLDEGAQDTFEKLVGHMVLTSPAGQAVRLRVR